MSSSPTILPDLVQSDVYAFSNIKKLLGGKRFTIKSSGAVNVYFEYLYSAYDRFKSRWKKCLELNRDYVEK